MDLSGKGYFLDRERLTAGQCVVRYLHPSLGPGWLFFDQPETVVSTELLADVEAALARVETYTHGGAYAVGFVSYEAGSAFEPHLPPSKGTCLPLLWFAIYPNPPCYYRELLPFDGCTSVDEIWPEWDRSSYRERFAKVREALGGGEIYQVNLSFRMRFKPPVTLFDSFRLGCGTQPPPYAAYLQGVDWEVASFSPELFIERKGEHVRMCPMKGTRTEMGGGLPELTTDPKSIAENLMIVDMVRNDLGKIAEIGSVVVPSLFHVELHRTVQQMISVVEARTEASFCDLFRSIFPPASVTGAPKVAACHMIHHLESSAREIYCGSIGMIEPNGDAQFSVAIRTAWRLHDNEHASYGIGSGLVWDSDLHDEFEECVLKAEVIAQPAPQWRLLECFHRDALDNEACLADHWDRLSRSAMKFEIPVTRDLFDAALEEFRNICLEPAVKVRVAITRTGNISVSSVDSAIAGELLKARLARRQIASGDENLRHKTTSRQMLDHALSSRPGADEVLLYNERGEICEFSRGNVLLRFGSEWVTPSPEVGCLPGIGVRRLVNEGAAQYRTVTVDQAKGCDEIRFVNSIRGSLPVLMDWSP